MIKLNIDEEQINKLEIEGKINTIAAELMYVVGIIYAYIEETSEADAETFKYLIGSFGSNRALRDFVTERSIKMKKDIESVFGDNIKVVVDK